MAREPRDYALLVGVKDYPYYPQFNNLTGPHDDVADVKKWLLNNETGGGLDPLHCEELLSTTVAPVQDHVDEKLDKIFSSVSASEPGRRLYVYFSGHGLASDVFGADLCLVRWSLKWRNAALSSHEYMKFLTDTGYFEEIVFWLDCCRTSKVRAKGMRPNLGVATANGSGTSIFTGYATEYQNAAYEADEGLDPIPGEAHGFFTRALLKALRGDAVSPNKSGVTATELRDYLYLEVPRLAKIAGKTQNPKISNELHPTATFGLATRSEQVTDISFSAMRSGIIELIGPEQELKRDDASTGPWSISLNTGALHVLKELTTGEELIFYPSDSVQNIIF